MRFTSSRRLARPYALLPLAMPILTDCMATATGGRTDLAAACSAFEPIRWSARDTDATIRSVKEPSAAWDAVCKTGGTLTMPPGRTPA